MWNRKEFLGAGVVGASLASTQARAAEKRKRMAIISTEWRYRSHVWHMGERFLVGYPKQGRWHQCVRYQVPRESTFWQS